MEIKDCGNRYIVTLTKNDFDKYDLHPEDIRSGEKASCENLPIKEIIEEIAKQTGDKTVFECYFVIKVGISDDDSKIIFQLERQDSSPTDIFSMLKEIHNSIMEKLQEQEEEERKKKESHTERAIFAKTISDIFGLIDLCPKGVEGSSVVKAEEGYYLFIAMTEEFTKKFDMSSGDYFDKVESDNHKMAYIKEHSEVLIANNTIEVLKTIK